jgi:hypothetical protein
MTPAVAIIALLTAISAVLQAFVARSMRRHTAALLGQVVNLHRINDALVQRLAEVAPCEVCGQPLAEGSTASVRLGPEGYSVVAHGLCLGPMPGQPPGYG